MTDYFQGDPALRISIDGATVVFVDGNPVMDQGWENAVLISLFTREKWAGNEFIKDPNKEVGSKFEESIDQPITILAFEDIADKGRKALKWMIDTGVASKTDCVATNPTGTQIDVKVTVTSPSGDVFELLLTNNGKNWIAQSNNPAHLKFDKIDIRVGGGGTVTVISINGKTGVVVLSQDDIGDGATYKQYSQSDKNKLFGIEESADVTDAMNVESAGAIMKNIIDAEGDILYGTANNSIARLAKDTDGKVLTLSSGVPTWATPTSGSGITGVTISMQDNFEDYDTTPEMVTGGWTLENQTNPWALTDNSLYALWGKQKGLGIDFDGEQIPSYTNTASVSHARKSVGLETDDITFCCEAWLRVVGELNFDDLKVHLIPSGDTTVAGTEIAVGWVIGEPSYSVIDDWIRVVFNVDPKNHNSTDLTIGGADILFQWRNDSASVTQPPAVINRITCWTSKVTLDEDADANWGSVSHLYLKNLNPTNHPTLIPGHTCYCPQIYESDQRIMEWNGRVWTNALFSEFRMSSSEPVLLGDMLATSNVQNYGAWRTTTTDFRDIGPTFFEGVNIGDPITCWTRVGSVALFKTDTQIERRDGFFGANNGYITGTTSITDGNTAISKAARIDMGHDVYIEGTKKSTEWG